MIMLNSSTTTGIGAAAEASGWKPAPTARSSTASFAGSRSTFQREKDTGSGPAPVRTNHSPPGVWATGDRPGGNLTPKPHGEPDLGGFGYRKA